MKTTETRYKVVKIFRVSHRRQIIAKDIKEVETARSIVNSYPNNNRSMVVYYSY